MLIRNPVCSVVLNTFNLHHNSMKSNYLQKPRSLIDYKLEKTLMRCATILKLKSLILCLFTIFFITSYAGATKESGEENASNPLAKVKNTDLRYQYLDMAGGHVNDAFIDGAFMALDSLKIKYELHYWETDLTGTSENNIESSTIKAIYFPTEGA